ncbi:histidine kinase dimerization/phospho-acceptor domain-containing protein [Mesorhizobium sp. BAC0120]|uniref:histidine kinase dimerization/phospho-acceptor domain-containing protein n=1 Tax=Mesorhizobium sp. BAC0120 TaxID=3090670 RepID=UPI00298CC3EB|nr:histidine kinase dimerization/phospho-acceptor domain-containing protein [Mesorhizobium sp. BAC0120]MDW6025139.1 histidine kinase dimerization/phospho-acceptor domain-containing protein [Mesorhizobium sp. BAC0120]
MPSGQYSYIDIAALDPIRTRFAEGEAMAILTPALDEVIWANGPGAVLFGYSDIGAIIGMEPQIGLAAKRQIMAAPGYPRIGKDRAVTVRLASGLMSRAISFSASEIELPGGEQAILLAVPAASAAWRSPAETASCAIAGLDQDGHYAAIVDGGGKLVAASSGFERLGIAAHVLGALASEARSERLVKRMLEAGDGFLPAGFVRLTDEPATFLLVVVDEALEGEAYESEPVADKDGAWLQRSTSSEAADLTSPADDPERAYSEPAGAGATSAEGTPRDGTDLTPAAEGPDASQDSGEGTGRQKGAADELAARETAIASDQPRESADEAPALAEDRPQAAEQVRPAASQPEMNGLGVPESASASAFDRSAAPVRFVWKTDAAGRFSEISQEFASAVRLAPGDLVGLSFREAAERLGIDPSGEIAGLLERHDTWSGRSVLWPVAGTELRIPVDLAALPTYDRDRNFAGFRGFGVARPTDAIVDQQASGFSLAKRVPDEQDMAASTAAAAGESGATSDEGATPGEQQAPRAPAEHPASNDPFQGEVPAISIAAKQERRQSDKVIRLAEHRPTIDKALSPGERNAFREIGDRLRKDSGVAAPVDPTLRADNDREPRPDAAPERQTSPEDETARIGSGAEGTLPGPDLDQVGSAGAPQAADAEAESAATELSETGAPEDEAVAEPGKTGDEAALQSATERELTGEASAATAAVEVAREAGTASSPEAAEAPPADRVPPRYLPSAFASGEQSAARAPLDTSILDKLPVPVLIHSGDVLHYANREFLDFTAYASVEELDAAGGLGELFGEPYPAEDDGDEPGRKLRLRTSQGLEHPVEAFLQSVPWGQGKALLLSLRRSWRQPVTYPAMQATAMPDGDADLEARIAEMRAIMDTATDGVVLIKPDGMIRSISRPAEALFGFDSKDVAGKPFTSLFAIESQRAAHDYLNGLSDHGVASVLNDGREVIGRESQGRFIPLFMTIGKLPSDSGYCAVMRDITQWKRAEEELTQARAQAERASSQKTEFLARVSHEIRTPLNAIIGFSELMLDGKFGPIGNDRYKDYLRDINRSGNHVLDLVNDLLDISKIEAGQQEMSYEAVSLNDTLAETVALMQPQANRERVIIRSSFASRLPEVVADLRSVRQIALNLLSNAIRYTPAGGQVIVSTAYEASGDVVMRVRDTGIGMSQPEIEQALKPFKQINALKRARGDGTGLGLPLTKAMVEANRARFIINSTPGEGTLVEITFPSTRVLAD